MNPKYLIYILNTPHMLSSIIGLGPECYWISLPFLFSAQTSHYISQVGIVKHSLQKRVQGVKQKKQMQVLNPWVYTFWFPHLNNNLKNLPFTCEMTNWILCISLCSLQILIWTITSSLTHHLWRRKILRCSTFHFIYFRYIFYWI